MTWAFAMSMIKTRAAGRNLAALVIIGLSVGNDSSNAGAFPHKYSLFCFFVQSHIHNAVASVVDSSLQVSNYLVIVEGQKIVFLEHES